MSERTIKVGSMELTEAEARKAGLLPEQRQARHARQAALLQKLGLGNTQEARALRMAAQRIGGQR